MTAGDLQVSCFELFEHACCYALPALSILPDAALYLDAAVTAYPHPTEVKYVLRNVQSLNAPLAFLLVSPGRMT